VFVLLAATALAEDHAELRKLINGYRNSVERKRIELVLPKQAPVVHADAAMLIRIGRVMIWLDRDGDQMRVTELRLRKGRERACLTGVISRRRFEALVRDLLLIRDSSLRHKAEPGVEEDRDAGDRWLRGPVFLRIELVTPTVREVLAEAYMANGGSRAYHRVERLGPPERALLSGARLEAAMERCTLTKTAVTEVATARLLDSLSEFPETFLDDLRFQLELQSERYDSLRDRLRLSSWSQRRSTIERAKNAEPLILAELVAANGRMAGRRNWLEAQLRERYPAAYRKHVKRRFRDNSENDVVREFWRLTHDRAVAPVLLATAGRKTEELGARRAALQLLTEWKLPDDADAIQAGLAAIVVDREDDVRVRGAAAAALGCLGDRRSIPALRRQLMSSTPERPVFIGSVQNRDAYLDRHDMRGPIALALAELRDKAAIPDLEALLADGETPERRAKMRREIARALATLR